MLHYIPSLFEPYLLYHKQEVILFVYTLLLKIFLHLFMWKVKGWELFTYWEGEGLEVSLHPMGVWGKPGGAVLPFHVELRDRTQVFKIDLTCALIVKQFSNVTFVYQNIYMNAPFKLFSGWSSRKIWSCWGYSVSCAQCHGHDVLVSTSGQDGQQC